MKAKRSTSTRLIKVLILWALLATGTTFYILDLYKQPEYKEKEIPTIRIIWEER